MADETGQTPPKRVQSGSPDLNESAVEVSNACVSILLVLPAGHQDSQGRLIHRRSMRYDTDYIPLY